MRVARFLAIALLSVWSAGGVQGAAGQPSPPGPLLVCIAFSPEVPPADSQPFRQAIAYAIDRDAVAKAAQVDPQVPYYPASTIQHPELPGFNPNAPGYVYNPAKAKTLFIQSGWTGSITISIPPRAARVRAAIHTAVRDSIQQTLGAQVILQESASLDRLLIGARRGQIAMFVLGWVSDRRDYGYPSFALGLANDLGMDRRDPELQLLVQRNDSLGVEQLLLEKALVIPIVIRN